MTKRFDDFFDYSACIDNLERKLLNKIVWNGQFWEFYILRDGKYSFSHSASTFWEGVIPDIWKVYRGKIYPIEEKDTFFDYQILKFIEAKLFNLIIFNPVTNQWQIGDNDTNVFTSYDFDFRGAVNRLICDKG